MLLFTYLFLLKVVCCKIIYKYLAVSSNLNNGSIISLTRTAVKYKISWLNFPPLVPV